MNSKASSPSTSVLFQENPKLAELYQNITQKECLFDEDLLLSQELLGSINQVRRSIERQRKEYLKNSLKLSLLEQCASDEFIKSESPNLGNEMQDWLSLSRCLELKDPVGVPASLIEKKLREIEERWESNQTVARILVPRIEQMATEMAKRIYSTNHSDLSTFSDMKFHQMAENVAQRVEQYQNVKVTQPILYEEASRDTLLKLADVISENLTQLCEVIAEMKSHFEFEKNVTFDAYHIQVMRNIKLKLEALKYELLLSIYDKNTTKVLVSIRDKFWKDIEELKSQLNESMNQLEAFAALGPNFRQIVLKYQNTLLSIVNVQKDLERLSNS